MTAFVARRSRRKTIRTIAASLLGIPILAAMAAGFGSRFDVAITVLASLFLLWNAWRAFARLGDREIRLRIDHDGIIDRALAERVIPWSVIRRVRPARWRHYEVVALDFAAPNFFRADEAARIPLGVIRRKYDTDAILTDSGLDVTLDDIALAIRRFRPDLTDCAEPLAI